MVKAAALLAAVLIVADPVSGADPSGGSAGQPGVVAPILVVRGGPTAMDKGGLHQTVRVRAGVVTGIESAEVTVSHDSAKPSGPFLTNRDGEAAVNLSGGYPTWVTVRKGVLAVSIHRSHVYWPLEVTVGPNASPVPGGTPAQSETMKSILSVRGGAVETPDGASEQRVRVLNRAGKGIEGVRVSVHDGNGRRFFPKWVPTDREGWASVQLANSQFESLGVHGARWDVTVNRGLLRWPLEVAVMTDDSKD